MWFEGRTDCLRGQTFPSLGADLVRESEGSLLMRVCQAN